MLLFCIIYNLKINYLIYLFCVSRLIIYFIYRFEICAISYFTLQHICHYLELQKMHQTSQILSIFTVEDIISTIDSVTFNPKIEKCCKDSVNLITFKTCKKIKVVPSQEIKKFVTHFIMTLNLIKYC